MLSLQHGAGLQHISDIRKSTNADRSQKHIKQYQISGFVL